MSKDVKTVVRRRQKGFKNERIWKEYKLETIYEREDKEWKEVSGENIGRKKIKKEKMKDLKNIGL